jgi:hypothetical protein
MVVQSKKIFHLLAIYNLYLGHPSVSVAKGHTYCSLKCNLKKREVMILKKGGKHIEEQKMEVVNGIAYLVVKQESTEGLV